MFHLDSSSSSPFSSHSTDHSSPEATTGICDPSSSTLPSAQNLKMNGYPQLAGMGGMPAMHGMGMRPMANQYQHPYPAYPGGSDYSHGRIPPPVDTKPFQASFPTSAPIATATRAPPTRGSHSAAASTNGSQSQGGARSEPPRRAAEVEDLRVSLFAVDELAISTDRNRLLLQGDPQVINKQRVETAIRVIIDLLRAIPASPSTPLPPPLLLPYLPHDFAGTIYALQRIGTFRTLRLQAGASTKASSKKQLQAGPTAQDHLAYLETAVFMSGENGKRVYACKRCRMREARRRLSKDQNRKKQSNSGSDTSSSNPKVSRSGVTPSANHITEANPDQYDPHRPGQVVEEPVWDPDRADWRHEIVLFNVPPEVPIKDGSCNWLPFRVVCYGKCHGEKVGFRIRFTIRAFDGRIIATSTTDPIKITDDHKTDTKAKPRVEGMTSSAQPAVPRSRKGRQSAASSRRQSPVPSEAGDGVVASSEAGAVTQKQTPSVRAGKPYERPPSLPPASATQGFDSYPPVSAPNFSRHLSSGSVHSVASMPALPIQNEITDPRWSRASSVEYSGFEQMPPAAGTVSPNALRRPMFAGFTTLDGTSSYPGTAPHSATSSNVASPSSALRPLSDDNLFLGDPTQSPMSLVSAFAELNSFAQQQGQAALIPDQPNPMLFDSLSGDVDMSTSMDTGFLGLLDQSSETSLASSFDDASGFSGLGDRSSAFYSESGLVQPEDPMETFLDYTGGEGDRNLVQPFGNGATQMTSPSSSSLTPAFDMDFGQGVTNALSPGAQAVSDAQIREFIAAMSQPAPPQPVITHVIPAEGPVAGGTAIAIAGQRFSPGVVIMFGPRVAKTTFVGEGFVQCILPPAAGSGVVDVTVQGVVHMPHEKQEFKYIGMDKEMMRLALEVRDQYQGSSSDAAYRLAAHVANKSASNSEWSDRSSASPDGPSPKNARAANRKAVQEVDQEVGLQEMIIKFLASLDENAPGSLRRSGAVNHRNVPQQTLLHLATVMGFDRLLRRLIVIGAHLDLQDVNGFTPLAFASLCGQVACARVLIEGGASYDRPTAYGEMPLDLAKDKDVEGLLLSAVWSTQPEEREMGDAVSAVSVETNSEIDNDNPSSDSEGEVSRIMRPKKSKRTKGKQKVNSPNTKSTSVSPRRRVSGVSDDVTPHATPTLSPTPPDDPPPYDGPADDDHTESWMSRTLSNIHNPSSHPHFKLPDSVWDCLPLGSLFSTETGTNGPKSQHGQDADRALHGWVAFPAPSWETLSKLASPEEIKLFTQAMAAAALNALVQSTAGGPGTLRDLRDDGARASRGAATSAGKRRKSRVGSRGEWGEGSPARQVVKQVKRDRMLYLFWLPILLFVGFWVMISALPIATGFCLIYARQITRAIKQRM